jgi:phospholipase C
MQHAEHPGPTDPNRQFATSGSTCGYVDNTNQSAGFFINSTGVTCVTSIFESLTNAKISWKNVNIPPRRNVLYFDKVTQYYESDITDAYMYKVIKKIPG